MHHLFCTFLPLLNSKKELSVPQPSIFSNEMRIAQISLNTDTAVWVIQLLPWWPEDLAFPSTAAHATLNTLHSPGAFPPSDMRVKQTSEMSAPKHWSRFCVIPRPFLYPAFAPCDTNTRHQRFPRHSKCVRILYTAFNLLSIRNTAHLYKRLTIMYLIIWITKM